MTTSPTNTSSQSRPQNQACDGADSSKAAVLQRAGRKKALLVGITYGSSEQNEQVRKEMQLELKGPHKDVENMKNLLIETYHYEMENIVMLLDNGVAKPPTRANIIEELEALVKDAKPGDHLLFHYAGHGGQKKLEKAQKTEDDGYNEAIIPCDASLEDDSGWILDDDLNRILVKSLGTVDCRLVAIFDMCHAGTALDLKHYECNRVYVPFITKSRRWTNFLRYRAQRRRDGTFMRASVEHADRGGLMNTESILAGKTRSRSTTLPECCDSIHSSTMPRSHSEYVGPSTQLANGLNWPRQDALAVKQDTYPSFAQADDAMAGMQVRDFGAPMPLLTSTAVPREQRKKLRINTKPLHNKRRSSLIGLTIPEDVENQETKQTNDPLSPSPGCGCLPPLSMRAAFDPKQWRLPFLRRSKESAQQSVDNSNADDQISESVNARMRAVSFSNGLGDHSSWPIRSDSAARNSHDHVLSACSEGRGHFVDSPLSASPIQTTVPEVKYDPCHVGHNLEEEPGPFVISLSACADGQQTFEDARGCSMTEVLVELLKNNPNPTYRVLMTDMSHCLYDAALRLHRNFRNREARQKRAALNPSAKKKKAKHETLLNEVQRDVLQHEPIQEAILGSERKLDLDKDRFDL